MKLHCSKILLFLLLLNILANNKNKPYITTDTPTTTSRVLSKCDMQTSIYDNDQDIKSVKENFNRQTSQRFEEHEKRMNIKRQKCKEQCDKDIEQIIVKDKMQKSFAEKVEKGCLKCGCGLGGVGVSVGIIGPIAVNEWEKAATAAAIASAKEAGALAGEAARIPAAIEAVIEGLESEFGVSELGSQLFKSFIKEQNYTNVSNISEFIQFQHNTKCLTLGQLAGTDKSFCSSLMQKSVATLNEHPGPVAGKGVSTGVVIKKSVESVMSQVEGVVERAANMAAEEATTLAMKTKTAAVDATYASCQTAIIASVVAILVIVLFMVIIYFILRYRRKKKINKRQQYTKLLNQ
ncbi:PIR protein, putative [Plasmodium sp.]|nr:PIR protein, putative [Plasmodium sp.]